jgi:hypothetical protein
MNQAVILFATVSHTLCFECFSTDTELVEIGTEKVPVHFNFFLSATKIKTITMQFRFLENLCY